MRVTDIKVECYSAPLARPIRNGGYSYATSDRCLIKVETDEGVVGVGIGGGGVGLTAAPQMIAATVDSLRPALVGQDPLAMERLWALMWSPKLIGRRGFTTRVISAIDVALWDLRGRAFGAPVASLLGAFHESLPAYIAGGYYEDDKGHPELAEEMTRYVEMGATAVKMKIGGGPLPVDLGRVACVRAAVGDEVNLLLDANNAYTAFEAVQVARALEPYNIFWLEEPVMPDDYRGLRRVSRATNVPIASGENEYTRYGFRDLLEQGEPSIINPDAQFLGGVTEFLKVAALAQANDVPVAPHGNHDVHVHLGTAIPNGLMIEYYPAERDPLGPAMQAEQLVLAGGQRAPNSRPWLRTRAG